MSSKYRDTLCGIAKISYQKQDYLDFMTMLDCFAGKQPDIKIPIKTSQYGGFASATGSGGHSSWWYMGLIQKMMDQVRGPDWTTYQTLQPQHKAVWDKVEEARRIQGRDGLSYQALLRVINGQNGKGDLDMMEKLLSSHRIW